VKFLKIYVQLISQYNELLAGNVKDEGSMGLLMKVLGTNLEVKA
jgi:hypothetical protein